MIIATSVKSRKIVEDSSSDNRIYIIALLVVVLIWAGSFIFIKVGLREIGPYNLALYRYLISAPIMLCILWKESGGFPKIDIKDLPIFIVLALTGVTLLYAVQFVAMEYTTATNSSILINTSVIFIAIMSFLFLNEKFTRLKAFGVLISFTGVGLILSNGSLSLTELFGRDTFVGDVLMVLDGFIWAIYTITGKKLIGRYSPNTIIAVSFVIGALLLFPFAIYERLINPFFLSLTSWISILYLAILSSVVAYIVWFRALEVMNATNVAVFVYLIPLFTVVMAIPVLGEKIGIFTVAGGLLIMMGVYLTERF
jgi:drug/metabolite transporter (DMT)-like permease